MIARTNIRSGFTLIEVLVSTLIFAVLVTAISSVLYSALHLRDNAQENIQIQEQLQIAYTIIKRDLINIVSPQDGLAGDLICEDTGRGNVMFDQLQCYTSSGIVSETLLYGEIQGIQYVLTDEYQTNEQNGYHLVRYIYRNLLATSEEEPTHTRLLEEVQSLDFRFYDGETWHETWNSSEEDPPLPKAIYTRITFSRDGEDDEQFEVLEFMVPIHTVAPVEEEEEEEGTESETDDTENEGEPSGSGGGQPNNGGGQPGNGNRGNNQGGINQQNQRGGRS